MDFLPPPWEVVSDFTARLAFVRQKSGADPCSRWVDFCFDQLVRERWETKAQIKF